MGDLRVGVLTCSDAIAKGESDDACGMRLVEACDELGWMTIDYHVCISDFENICNSVLEMCDVDEADIVLTIGAVGLGVRDVAPDVLRHVCDREIPGLAEEIRRHGSSEDLQSVLSRAAVGIYGRTLVVNLPERQDWACKAFERVSPLLEVASEDIKRGYVVSTGEGS